MKHNRPFLFVALFSILLYGNGFGRKASAAEPILKADAAKRDITPQEPVPMWGYGERHAQLSIGTLDPLYASVVVIQAGERKLAIVGLDLGRSPSEQSFQNIRNRIKAETGIVHSFIAGSHTHHGPVLELSDAQGKGMGRYDAAFLMDETYPCSWFFKIKTRARTRDHFLYIQPRNLHTPAAPA